MTTISWLDALDKAKDGRPKQNAMNFGIIMSNYQKINSRLWFDEVRGKPMYIDKSLTDEHISELAVELGEDFGLAITNLRLLERYILVECKRHTRDLLQEWLISLPKWDKKPRLSTWLHDIAGSQDDCYGRAISRIIPLSMVARALDPGCHYRYVVIFEGPENAGKTTLVRVIATEDWFGELSMGLNNKEAHMKLQGKWVVELAELDSLTTTRESRLKAFITMNYDRYVPKYSNFEISIPRRSIFIGTTNDESYLRGKSGNTRFLPIKISNDIKVKEFISIRDQIFAEAFHEYEKNTETWWQFSEEVLSQATIEREDRREINVYEEELELWLEGKNETCWAEIARDFLKLETPAQWERKSLQMQVADALKALGWSRRRTRIQGIRVWMWYRHDPTPLGRDIGESGG